MKNSIREYRGAEKWYPTWDEARDSLVEAARDIPCDCGEFGHDACAHHAMLEAGIAEREKHTSWLHSKIGGL